MNPFLYELSTAPPSSTTSYVLPWDSKISGFSTENCDPILSDCVVTEAHLAKLIEELKKNPYYCPKKVSKLMWFLMGLVVIIIGLFIIMERALSTKVHAALGWRLGFSLFLFVGLLILVFHFTSVYNFNQRRTEKLKDSLKKIEKTCFDSSKTSLIISNLGSYIQIFFLWKVPHRSSGQFSMEESKIKTHTELLEASDPDPEDRPLRKASHQSLQNLTNTIEMQVYQPAFQGDSSPPPVNCSPRKSSPVVMITRDIQIHYSPESRAQEVKEIALDKLRN